MSRIKFTFALTVSMIVPCAPTAGAQAEGPSRDNATAPIESELLEEVEVFADATNPEVERLEPEFLEAGRMANLGVGLVTLPGVSGVHRSQNAVEPVVRGLGWERVQTELNGVPLYGACPGRMDPPSTTFPASSISQVSVVRGLSSVSLGPAGTGGRVVVSTDHDRGAGAGRQLESWTNLSYADARGGFIGSAGLTGGTDTTKIDVCPISTSAWVCPRSITR